MVARPSTFGGRPLRPPRPRVVGPERAHAGPAQVQPGPSRLRPRRGRPAFRARPARRAPARRARRRSTSAAAAACSPSRWPASARRVTGLDPAPDQPRRRPRARRARRASPSTTGPTRSRRSRAGASASTSCSPWRWSSTSRTCRPSSAACCRAVKPGGLLFLATINRTARAFALAIVGAEYVLGWLPRGHARLERSS